MARPRARGMEEGAAGAAGAIDDRLGELLHAFRVVGALLSTVIDEPCPSASDSDDAIAFTQCSDGDCPDGRVEPRNVSASGEDGNGFLGRHGAEISAHSSCGLMGLYGDATKGSGGRWVKGISILIYPH